MWTIIKIDKKKIDFLKKDFQDKIGEKLDFYNPKLKITKYNRNKLIYKEVNLLGDYLFCYIEGIEEKLTVNKLKFSRGLKYFLNGFIEFQDEIKQFINECKKHENNDGYITHNFFPLVKNKTYKFSTGPFVDKIFRIINLDGKKIEILLGGLNTTIKKDKYLFNPV